MLMITSLRVRIQPLLARVGNGRKKSLVFLAPDTILEVVDILEAKPETGVVNPLALRETK
jgi:hypothetical protein